MSNLGNVAGGHKATISNPNTSEEAKEHSRQVLATEIPSNEDSSSSSSSTTKDPSHVISGLKSAIHNPRVSDEAKQDVEAKLAEMDVPVDDSNKGASTAGGSGTQQQPVTEAKKAVIDAGKNPVRVEAGLKAAMNNPNVTEEGGALAKEKLEEMEG